jgi:hypothetical protein
MQKAVEKIRGFFCVYAKRNGLNPDIAPFGPVPA